MTNECDVEGHRSELHDDCRGVAIDRLVLRRCLCHSITESKMTTTTIGTGVALDLRRERLDMTRIVCWILLPLISSLVMTTDVDALSTPDWRIVTYEDLHMMASTHLFERNGFSAFAKFAVDLKNDQIIVGIRDNIIRLRLSNLSVVEIVPWLSDGGTVGVCLLKGQSKENCHNFIRVLIIHEDRLFACGTNSYAPQCSWRKMDSLNVVDEWVTGVAKCPYSPHQNSTYVMTSDGNFYSATVTDFTGRDAAIYRMMGPSRNLRTAQYNSRWLNEPDFVSAYDIGDYVYFFFREVAVEYINCGKAIYSRVARICKSDLGGKLYMEDKWTTFLKARLNCSLPGNYPFYFSELQSTYYDNDLQLLFAVLTTSPTSIYGSAVCIYNMTSFDQAFSGAFKYQENSQSAWIRAPNNPSSLQCSHGVSPGKRSSDGITNSHRHLVDVQKFQMMDSAVQPSSHIPPLLAENERWTHVVTDRVRVIYNSIHTEVIILFVATLEGVIKKFFLLPQPVRLNDTSVSTCFLEELHLMPSDRLQPIEQLELIRPRSVLLVGTVNRVYQLSTHRCHRFTSKLQCQNMQDPYCQWNEEVQECLGTGHQNLTSCPQLNFPVDGNWSSWSSWQSCSSPTFSSLGENEYHGPRCLCRSRTCDSPPPYNGGIPCAGPAIQIINCTNAGAMDRKKLEGEEKVHDCWSDWSEWTSCSSHCHQSRSRSYKKLSGASKHSKLRCLGNRKDTRVCFTKKCAEIQKASNWSQWYVAKSTSEGRYEERLHCSCEATLSGSGRKLHARLEADSRFCSSDDQNCTESDRKINISSPTTQLQSDESKCKKTSETEKRENAITKQNPVSSMKNSSRVHVNPKSMDRRIIQRSSFPTGQTANYGYCGCRDLGMFRICYKCPLS